MKTIEELNDLIEQKQSEIQDKQDEIDDFEIDESYHEESYRDMLDDCYPELFNMQPSRILEECDPIAYKCGLSDYVDGYDLDDLDEYKDLLDELEELQNDLEKLEDELNNLDDEE
jgi:predicted nuclease with TOPRIM domain